MTVSKVVSLPEQIMSVVEHLHGDLYRVPLNFIKYAEDTDAAGMSFYNPRHSADKSGKLVAKGFSKDEMTELRDDIRRSGLNDPLLARPVEVNGKWVLQLVDGERRKRSLDALVKKNEKCFDPSAGVELPASELYSIIDCRIRIMDERTAFRQAVAANATSIDIGEGATLNLVRILREKGADDEYLREVTNKSSSWVRETDRLLNLDAKSFEALCQEKINRRVALSLAEEKDVKVRLTRLEKLLANAQERLNNMKAKAENELAKADETLEEAETINEVLGAIGGDVTKSQEDLEAAKEKVEKRRKNLSRVEKNKAKVTGKDIEAVEGEVKALTVNKILKHWQAPVLTLLKSDDTEEIENLDMEDLHLVALLCNKIEAGEKDIVSILQTHYKNKSRNLA